MRVGTEALTFEVAPPWDLGIESENQEVVGIAVNSRDEVHVATRSAHPVLVLTLEGRFLRSFGEGIMTFPHGIHIGPDDTVWLADNMDSTVRKFSPRGELLLTLGTKDRPSDTAYRDGDYRTIARGAGPFNEPTNIAVAPAGDIYITDGYGNARVHRFSEDGKHVASFGEPGAGPGQFNIPHTVFVDRHGTLYVGDRENNRIQVFDGNGAFRGSWDDVRRPDDIYITSDDLVFVAEQGHRSGLVPGLPDPTDESPVSRVTVRDLQGEILAKWGADENPETDDPCAPGNFFAAHGIWVDRHGTVYVGEVIYSGNGMEGQGGGAGWVAPGCHALQRFTRV